MSTESANIISALEKLSTTKLCFKLQPWENIHFFLGVTIQTLNCWLIAIGSSSASSFFKARLMHFKRGRGCTSSAFSFAWQPSCKPKTSVLTWKGQLPRAAPALHRCLNKKGSATIGFAFNVTPALMKRLERGGTRRGPSTRTHKNYFNTDEWSLPIINNLQFHLPF